MFNSEINFMLSLNCHYWQLSLADKGEREYTEGFLVAQSHIHSWVTQGFQKPVWFWFFEQGKPFFHKESTLSASVLLLYFYFNSFSIKDKERIIKISQNGQMTPVTCQYQDIFNQSVQWSGLSCLSQPWDYNANDFPTCWIASIHFSS